MKQSHSIAVVLLRTTGFNSNLDIADVEALMERGAWSVLDYWRQNTAGWLRFPKVDYFGPYVVEHPTKIDPATNAQQPDRSRETTISLARQQMRAEAHDPSAYDHIVVVLDPSGTAFDGGAWGDSCVVGVGERHSVFVHEVGHVLGFDHTYGILTDAANWDRGTANDDGITMYPEYGDPFDIMSALRFGGTSPSHSRNAARQPHFPNAHRVGPMAARAMVWLYDQRILDAETLTAYQNESDPIREITLYGAGRSELGHAELVVFRPDGATNTQDDVGTVLVEYRRSREHHIASRWDHGLSERPSQVAAAGIVVHVVEPAAIGEPKDRVASYRTRLQLLDLQRSVVIDTPRGQVMVVASIDEFNARSESVKVRVGRPSAFAPQASIAEEQRDVETVISTYPSPVNVGNSTLSFTRETVHPTRYSTFRATVVGLPAVATTSGPAAVTATWTVGGVPVTSSRARTLSVRDEQGLTRRLTVAIEGGQLMLDDALESDAFTVSVEFRAAQDNLSISDTTRFEAAGDFERWGDDHRQFFAVFDRLWVEVPPLDLMPDLADLEWSTSQLVTSLNRLTVRHPALADHARRAVAAHVEHLRSAARTHELDLPIAAVEALRSLDAEGFPLPADAV